MFEQYLKIHDNQLKIILAKKFNEIMLISSKSSVFEILPDVLRMFSSINHEENNNIKY
jgi:hypothetical protein